MASNIQPTVRPVLRRQKTQTDIMRRSYANKLKPTNGQHDTVALASENESLW